MTTRANSWARRFRHDPTLQAPCFVVVAFVVMCLPIEFALAEVEREQGGESEVNGRDQRDEGDEEGEAGEGSEEGEADANDEEGEAGEGSEEGDEIDIEDDDFSLEDLAAEDPELAAMIEEDPELAAELEDIPELETVVTSTRFDTQAGNVPETVTVIGADEARRRSAVHGDDLVRTVPSLSIRRPQGPATAYPQVMQIRGVSGIARTLVAIDGMPLNDPLIGAPHLNMLPTERIQRVEIVRGPFSALWGSYAMAGLINVVTQPGGVDPGFTLSAAAGPYDTVRITGSAAGQVSWFEAAVTYDHRQTSNYLSRSEEPNLDFMHHRMLLRLDANRGERYSATLTTGFYLSDSGFNQYVDMRDDPTTGFYFRNEGRTRKNNYFVRLAGRFRALPSLEFHTAVGVLYQWSRFAIEPFVLEGTLPATRLEQNTSVSTGVRLEGSGRWSFARWGALVVGVDQVWDMGSWENSSLDTGDLVFGMRAGASITGGYGQGEFQFLDDRLRIIIGTRVDKHSTFGWAVSPRGGLYFEPVEGTILRAAAGRAFRSPTLVELYVPPWVRIPPNRTVGNSELEPEQLWAIDWGIEQLLTQRLAARLTGFFIQGESTIQLELQENGLEPYVNGPRYRNAGVEAELLLRPRAPFELRFSYSWTWTEDLSNGEPLDYVPEHLVGFLLMVYHQFGDWTLEGAFDLEVVGPQWYSNVRNREERGIMEGRAVGNLSFRVRRGPVSLFIDMRNLWNADYAETNEIFGPRFTVLAGARLESSGWDLGRRREGE